MSESRVTLSRLAAKWHEVPTSSHERTSTLKLLQLSDDEFLKFWEDAREETSDGLRGFELRGWFYAVYAPWAAGKKILEVGSGIGIDGVALARAGAEVTFVDVSGSNLDVVRRVWALKGLGQPDCLHLQQFEDLERLDTDFDAVVAFGSLHHIPSDEGKPEFEGLARRLKPGGRFIMHAYPFQRWINEGRMSFDSWGEKTDGPGTPWAEWYDTKKLLAQLRPSQFAPVLYCEYRAGAMNCIDLIKTDGHPDLRPFELSSAARKVPGALRLQELKAEASWSPGDAVLVGSSIRVTTAPEPWSYAAAMPMHFEEVPPSARCVIAVCATVEMGRIGIGVVKPEGSAFITEAYLSEDNDRQTCWLEFMPSKAAGSSIVIRNASPTSSSSRVLIHSVDLFTVRVPRS